MRHPRTRRATAVVLAAGLLLVPALGAAADVDDPDGGLEVDDDGAADEEAAELEDSSLGGYRLRSEATPLGMLLWEPLLPFPVDPGDPHMVMHSAYTRTTFNTGPTGRALASALWPGDVFGDSLEQVIPGQDYPLMANARVPQGPEEQELELAPGMRMHTTAEPTAVEARSTTTDLPSDALGVGTYESTSRSFLDDGMAVTTAHSAVSDVEILEGLVTIGSIVTDLEARGDGARAATSGSTAVSGLTIAGFGFVLDEDGLRPETGEEDEESPLPFEPDQRTPDEIREELGIELELLPHEEELDGGEALRSAGGVRVSIDVEVLRSAYLDEALGPLMDQLPDDLRHPPVPDEMPFNPIDVLFLEPRIDVILARGVVEANTVEQLDFEGFGMEMGDLGDPGPSQAPAPEVDQAADFEGTGADAPTPSTDAPGPMGAGDPVAEPEISETPPGEEQTELQAIGAGSFPDAAGSTTLAALVAMGLAGLGARGLHGMTGRVFGGGAGCEAGHPTGVPNLKET